MIVTSARNPVWYNAEQTAIKLFVTFEEIGAEIPFIANPNDTEEHGRLIYANAVDGDYGAIAAYQPPVVVVTVPAEITALQFLIAAAISNIITQQEAIDAAQSGTIPSSIQAVFSQLTLEEQFVAKVRWARMTIIPRTDPLVTAVGAAFNMNSAQLDDFFIQAAQL